MCAVEPMRKLVENAIFELENGGTVDAYKKSGYNKELSKQTSVRLATIYGITKYLMRAYGDDWKSADKVEVAQKLAEILSE